MKLTQLYGGAITIPLPENLIDLSAYREVPNHQEVFADSTEADESLIIEINELSKETQDDEAAKFHFIEICDMNEVPTNFRIIDKIETIDPSLFNLPANSTVQILYGRQLIPKRIAGKNQVYHVLFYLALFRLKNVQSDLLVNFHHPLEIVEEGIVLEKIAFGDEKISIDRKFEEMVKGFKIIDWKLFG